MSWVPFVPDLEAWKNHFLSSSSRHLNKKSSIIGQVGSGGISNKIKLVTPTEQAVERAKSEIKRRKKEGEPVVTFRNKRNEKSKKAPQKKTKQSRKQLSNVVKSKNTVKNSKKRKSNKNPKSRSSQKKTFAYL